MTGYAVVYQAPLLADLTGGNVSPLSIGMTRSSAVGEGVVVPSV